MNNNIYKIPNFINSELDYNKINNKYEIIKDDFPDIYKVNLYYLEKNLCLFNLIRLDSENGWDKDLRIKIYSEDKNKNEIISIGRSFKNEKKIEIYLNIDLVEKERKFYSKNIIETRDNDFKDLNEKEIFYKFISKNNEHNYYNFDKKFRRDFIIDNFKDKLNIYDTISDNNLKKRIFILCYLNFKDGFYLDENLENSVELNYFDLNENIIQLKNNNFYLLNCKEDSIDIKKLFSNIDSKEKLCFKNYIKDLKELELDIKCDDKIEFSYYDNIFLFENYKILILDKNNNFNFIIEEMDEGYYLLKEKDDKDFYELKIKYINLLNNNEGFLNKDNYKLSKNNLKIFKID